MNEKPVQRLEAFEFNGTTGEYFRIWIVNICLTIITLGIYSPWAKVRKLKYFYQNTRLADSGFDYHASPLAILKGRIIAVVGLAIYIATGYFAPGVDAIILLIILCFVPWLVVRSRMFNLRNTSFQNIRFSFPPVYGEAYKVMLLYPILVALTLGLAYPWYKARRSAFLIDNTSFGNLDFNVSDITGGFYKRYIATLAGLLALGILAATVVGFSTMSAFQDQLDFDVESEYSSSSYEGLDYSYASDYEESENYDDYGDFTEDFETSPDDEEFEDMDIEMADILINSLGSIFLLAPVLLVYFAVFFALAASIAKYLYNSTNVSGNEFRCRWSVFHIVVIQITNLLAIVLSFGLLIPWASVRLWNYQFSHLDIEMHTDLNEVLAVQSENVSALGDEIGEAFDFDMGI